MGSVLFAIAILGSLWGTLAPTVANTPVPGETLCPDSIVPSDFSFSILGAVQVQGNPPLQTVLTRVDLQPDAQIFPNHCHDGAFVLWVDWGSICFEQGATNGAKVTAVAPVSNDTGTCPVPETQIDCSGDGCTLNEGDTVYLPAGSVVTQSATAFHSYGNADDAMPAVVYSTQTLPISDNGPGCGSGCPKP